MCICVAHPTLYFILYTLYYVAHPSSVCLRLRLRPRLRLQFRVDVESASRPLARAGCSVGAEPACRAPRAPRSESQVLGAEGKPRRTRSPAALPALSFPSPSPDPSASSRPLASNSTYRRYVARRSVYSIKYKVPPLRGQALGTIAASDASLIAPCHEAILSCLDEHQDQAVRAEAKPSCTYKV